MQALSFLCAILLAFVKQVRFRTPQVDDLRTPVTLHRTHSKCSIKWDFLGKVPLTTRINKCLLRILRNSPHILFHLAALFAVEGIRNTRASTNDTSSLVRAVVAFVTNPNERVGSDLAIAYWALAIALFAEASDRCTYTVQYYV